MARFFFDLHNGTGLTRDEQGQEAHPDSLADLAVASIRSILSDEVRQGLIDLTGRIDIRNITGAVILTVAFRDAVTLRLSTEHR